MPKPIPAPNDPLLTAKEVAVALRVGKSTVYRLLAADEIASLRIGRSLRVRQSDLDAYLGQGGSDLEVYAPTTLRAVAS